MRHSQRLPFLLLVLLTLVAAGCSSASTPTAPTAKTATGEVMCTHLVGQLTFSPPLKDKGTSAETTAISLQASGCTASGSNVSAVTGSDASGTITSPTNSCTALLTSRTLSIRIIWAPSTIRPSVLTFSGYRAAASGSGGQGFALPNTGGTAKVTGSFSGSDQGAASSAQTYSGQTATQLLAACGSSVGLTSLQVTSGTVTLR